MKNLYGIKNLAIDIVDARNETPDLERLNNAIAEHDGKIVEVQTVAMLYGVTRYIIIYKKG